MGRTEATDWAVVGMLWIALALAGACSSKSKVNSGSDATTASDTASDTTTSMSGVFKCSEDKDCPNGSTCMKNPPNGLDPVCIQPCGANDACPQGFACNTTSKNCEPTFGPKVAGTGCTATNECSLGLSCMDDGAGKKICSKSCTGTTDCPSPTVCKGGPGKKVCQFPSFCEACEKEGDCGAGKSCQTDGKGGKFCSISCTDVGTKCPGGFWCKMDNAKVQGWCLPLNGSCKGDGTLCSTCQENGHCPNGICYHDPQTNEKFCSKECVTADDCKGDTVIMECVQDDTLGKTVCQPKPAQNIQGMHGTCYAGKVAFCGYCEDNSWCAPTVEIGGVKGPSKCYIQFSGGATSPIDGSHTCTLDCTNGETCPLGTKCIDVLGEGNVVLYKACRPTSATVGASCNSGMLCSTIDNCDGIQYTGRCDIDSQGQPECVTCDVLSATGCKDK